MGSIFRAVVITLLMISLTGCISDNKIPPEKYLHSFYEGEYAHIFVEEEEYKKVVLDDNKVAYVGLDGYVIHYAYTHDEGPDYFSEGLSRYIENGKVGFINEDLEVVIPAQFTWAGPFKDGTAKICKKCERYRDGDHSQMVGGIWGTLDKNGIATWDKK